MAGIPWSSEEDNLIRKSLKENISFNMISDKYFPNRSSNAIRLRAIRYLGLTNENYVERKYRFNHDFWAVPNNNNSYWAGLLAGDGSIGGRGERSQTVNWTCHYKDKSWQEQLLKDADSDYPICVHKKKGYTYHSKISISSGKACEDLAKNFNVIRRKTHRLSPPPNLPEEMQYAYLCGLTDADGCIHPDKGHEQITFSWVGASLSIIEWIKKITDRFVGVRKPKPRNVRSFSPKDSPEFTYHQFHIAGISAVKLYFFLKSIDCPHSSRKWKNPKVEEIIKKQLLKFPNSV